MSIGFPPLAAVWLAERARRDLASAISVDTEQSACVKDDSYEPHCLNDWAEMVKATDEMVRAAG